MPDGQQDKDLMQRYEEKRAEMAEKKKTENPEGRLTGLQLEEMFVVISGHQVDRAGNIRKMKGLGDIQAGGASFKRKLMHNFQKVRDEVQIIQAIMPTLPDEKQKRLDEYNERRNEVARRNTNLAEDYKGEVTEQMIASAGNLSIYKAEIAGLDKDYRDVLDARDELAEKRREWLNEPVIKLDFDLIREEEIPEEVTANQRLAIAPMIADPGAGG